MIGWETRPIVRASRDWPGDPPCRRSGPGLAGETHPVVGAGVAVVQHFQAALHQGLRLGLGDLHLVLQRLPHQRLGEEHRRSHTQEPEPFSGHQTAVIHCLFHQLGLHKAHYT